MEGNVVLHDRRLAGSVAGFNGAVIPLDATTSLRGAFGSIRSYAGTSGGLQSLFVACHGFAGSNRRAGVSMDAGGMGLQLGRENVTHANVNTWGALKNVTKNIVVYACAAANTEPGNEFTTADGMYLMGALAICTNARVFASNRIQWYKGARGIIDFGRWEGQLYSFMPDGQRSTARRVPVEMAMLLGRRAAP